MSDFYDFESESDDDSVDLTLDCYWLYTGVGGIIIHDKDFEIDMDAVIASGCGDTPSVVKRNDKKSL